MEVLSNPLVSGRACFEDFLVKYNTAVITDC
jgi:hypothetical protein